MLNKIIAAFLISLVSAVHADTVSVNPDHPDEYVVQKGDTLWDISGRFLQQPWLWPEVWKGNPQITNPHLIYPGDVVRLSYVDGSPILSVSGVQRTKDGRIVKLTPAVRSYERDDAIPAIPIEAIKSFLTRPLVVNENEMEEWPYIVASYDQHLIASSGNEIYVRGLDESAASRRFAVYRQGGPYIKVDEDGQETLLGYEALYVGDAIIKQGGDPATGVIAAANREILIGDRLREEQQEDVNSDFIPRPPVRDVQGNIISVIDGVTQIGQYQVVVLDLGTEHGLEVGNVLGIYQGGVMVNDKIAASVKQKKKDKELLQRIEETDYEADGLGGAIAYVIDQAALAKQNFDNKFTHISNLQAKPEKVRLPESSVGVLMVIRTFDKLSYGLVMDATAPVHLYDQVKSM